LLSASHSSRASPSMTLYRFSNEAKSMSVNLVGVDITANDVFKRLKSGDLFAAHGYVGLNHLPSPKI
jgi:hypothetical protein